MKCFAVSGSQSDYMVPLYQRSVPCNLQSSVNITISPFGNDVTRLRGGSPSSMPLPGIIDSMARHWDPMQRGSSPMTMAGPSYYT